MRKHVGGELMTIDDYRNRYAQYRSDPALRAAHASFPFIVVWDDHEVDNNYAGLNEENGDAGRAVRAAPGRRLQGVLRAHAAAARSIPKGALLQLYRPFTYGTLASISMLDTRQYRTDQPCGDNVQLAVRGGAATRARRCWVPRRKNGSWIASIASRPGWNILAQQIPMARLDRFAGPERGSRWTNGTDTSRAARAC